MATAAKRGDLAVFEVTRRDYYIGQESPPERKEYTAGVVTSITRDGKVTKVRMSYSDRPTDAKLMRYDRLYLVASDLVDVEAALTACHANEWEPGYPGKPFDSLEQIREVIRLHKLATGSEES